jgi:hypothetical protein
MIQRIIDRTHVGEVLQRMYFSRLTAELSISLESGYFYMVTSKEKTSLRGTTVEEAVTDIAQRLAAEFPQSQFAIWWKLNFMQVEEGG